MDIFEKMAATASELKDKLTRGEQISKEDRRFLNSYIGINGKGAGNAGKKHTRILKAKC